MSTRNLWLALAVGVMAMMGCGGSDDEVTPEDQAALDGKEDSAKKTKTCGGFAGIQCPAGYTCKLNGDYPDASGKCVVTPKQTCANVKCASGTHCEMKGINGGSIPVCIKDDMFCGGFAGITCPAGYTCELDGTYPDAGGTCVVAPKQTCANVKCASGTHCEMKGINGGSIPVCIKDATPTCADVQCLKGQHCEMKGINGGSIPVCLEDVFCGGFAGIACAAGYTCHLDGSYPDAGGHCVPK
jgi:hypothetical protein